MCSRAVRTSESLFGRGLSVTTTAATAVSLRNSRNVFSPITQRAIEIRIYKGFHSSSSLCIHTYSFVTSFGETRVRQFETFRRVLDKFRFIEKSCRFFFFFFFFSFNGNSRLASATYSTFARVKAIERKFFYRNPAYLGIEIFRPLIKFDS